MNVISLNHQRFDTSDLKPAEVAQLVMLASRLTSIDGTGAAIRNEWVSAYYLSPLTVSLSRTNEPLFANLHDAQRHLETLKADEVEAA